MYLYVKVSVIGCCFMKSSDSMCTCFMGIFRQMLGNRFPFIRKEYDLYNHSMTFYPVILAEYHTLCFSKTPLKQTILFQTLL